MKSQTARDEANPRDEEFYIGYLPTAPAGVGRFAKICATLLAPLAIAVAFAAAVVQRPMESGWYEFGEFRKFEGVLYEEPTPVLRVAKPGGEGVRAGYATLLLCGSPKFGIPDVAKGNHGKRVSFEGSLIYRQGLAMIEMNKPETFKVLGEPGPGEARGEAEPWLAADVDGKLRLRGEIVDTKCFFGVMRPGVGKVHRACAIRCLEGGIPAGLWVRGEDGVDIVFLLAGPKGRKLDLDFELAALPVEIFGAAEWHDGVPVLRVETIKRL